MPTGVDSEKTLEKIVEYAKKYGFFYKAQEIYGGKAGFYDYGSIGVRLKRNFENVWRNYFGKLFDNIWEIEPTDIMHEDVFKASKHLELFNDPITECSKGHRFRADKLIEEKLGIKADSLTIDQMNDIFKSKKIVCPDCGSPLSEVKMFNLMFPIFVGPESGELFLILNELKNRLDTEKKYMEKLLKFEDKYTFSTEDGVEFITILMEEFYGEDLYLLEKDMITYIFNRDFTKILKYDMFTREAFFYVDNKDLKSLVEAKREFYENKNLDEEFEKVLEKCKVISVDIDFEDYVERILKSYKELLKNRMFLRPETAQGPYVNFPLEIRIHRNKLPLGLMVIGKAFRNEISPRQALLRMREFTQAELQIFFNYEEWINSFEEKFDYDSIKDKELILLPVKYRDNNKSVIKTIDEWKKELNLPKFYLYFLYKVQEFYLDILKVPIDRFRFYELSEEEKSFYNKIHFDVEIYLDELGWVEVGGIHFRAIEIPKKDIEGIKDKKVRKYLEKVIGDKDKVLVGYDVYNHLLLSKDVNFILDYNGRKILPVELELSFGVDRNVFALLWINYDIEKLETGDREVLRLPYNLAPIKIAVFSLLEKDNNMKKIARNIYDTLKLKYDVFYDESGSIGKRYRRQDAIGTPLCITIDGQTIEDSTVTIRFRDTMKQIRVKIEDLEKEIEKYL